VEFRILSSFRLRTKRTNAPEESCLSACQYENLPRQRTRGGNDQSRVGDPDSKRQMILKLTPYPSLKSARYQSLTVTQSMALGMRANHSFESTFLRWLPTPLGRVVTARPAYGYYLHRMDKGGPLVSIPSPSTKALTYHVRAHCRPVNPIIKIHIATVMVPLISPCPDIHVRCLRGPLTRTAKGKQLSSSTEDPPGASPVKSGDRQGIEFQVCMTIPASPRHGPRMANRFLMKYDNAGFLACVIVRWTNYDVRL